MKKLELGEDMELNMRPVGGDYQHDSLTRTVQAEDASGADISDQFAIVESNDDPPNPLHCFVRRTVPEGTTETECTGLVTVAADGDADPGEEFPIKGLLAFSYDSPNAQSFEIDATSVPRT